MEEFTKALGTTKQLLTAYHSQTDSFISSSKYLKRRRMRVYL